jgi:adenylate cyclase
MSKEEHVERKLAAILSADVKGYSRLMGEDEEGTLRTLTAYREVTDALIHQCRGRIVGTAGDSVLAEFASVVDAVRCAVEIQQQLKTKNADLPAQRRMEFRIGINLGKGKAVKVEEVGRELGVQYVLEGSIRKASNRVRITVQLVDATTSHHLWAERYDRELTDIFALQDEIVQKIVTTLKLQLTLWEQGVLVPKTTENLEAYDYYLRGQAYWWHVTKEGNVLARQMFEKAVELDPTYATAYIGLGATYFVDWAWQWSQDPRGFQQCVALAQRAIALDDSLPQAHVFLGIAYLWQRQHEQAIAEVERSIALDHNSADSHVWLAHALKFVGRAEETIRVVDKAMRLNPRYPVNYLFELGMTSLWTGRYQEAVSAFKGMLARAPDHLPGHLHLAASYSELGQEEEARAEAAEVLRLNPQYLLEAYRQRVPVKDPAVLERTLAALRKAGLK